MENTKDAITLLVIEENAEWPTWGTGLYADDPDTVVDTQREGEPVEEFQTRVLKRIRRLSESGTVVRSAGYACALAREGRLDCRRQICCELMKFATSKAGAELVLAGGAWDFDGPEGEARAALFTLWGQLSSVASTCQASTSCTVSVCFAQEAHDSGVFRTAPDVRQASGLSEAPDLSEASDLSEAPGVHKASPRPGSPHWKSGS